MYIAFLSILVACSLGFGIWASLPTFTAADYSESRAKAIAQVILEQHNQAVAWVEQEDNAGVRINAGFEGKIEPQTSDVGAIHYSYGTFADVPTERVSGASNADWATVTWLTPDMQESLTNGDEYTLKPDSVLRNIIDKSGANRYGIGTYHVLPTGTDPDGCIGEIEPLDRSAELSADPSSPWSPMDDRDPSAISATPKPATKVQWKTERLPCLTSAPSGLEDGSWVIVTMTPSSGS